MATVLVLLLSMMAVVCCQGASVVPVKAIPFPSGNISTIVVDGGIGKQPETNIPDGKINEVIETNNVVCVTNGPETTTTTQTTTAKTTTPTVTTTTTQSTTTTQATTTTKIQTTTTEEEEDSGSGSGDGSGSGGDSENDDVCFGDFIFSSELNKCYLFSKERLDWFYARESCWRYGSSLVSIQSQEENEYLMYELEKRSGDFLIGGSDSNRDLTFEWDPDMTSFTYTDWAPGQPNNEGGYEQCMELKYYIEHNRYYWNDAPCHSFSRRYICEATPEN